MKRWTVVGTLALALLLAACVPPASSSPTGAPPAPTGVRAFSGGGSGEVEVDWYKLPTSVGVAFYRVYERKAVGTFWLLGIVTDGAFSAYPGRVGLVDAPDYWPWPSLLAHNSAGRQRCYVVTAVSTRGLEGAMSTPVCGYPPPGT